MRVQTYNARRGRMGVTAIAAIDRLMPIWGIEVSESQIDLGATFGSRPVVVEIGAGTGEATLAMAAADSTTAVVAIEVHRPGVNALLRGCDAQQLSNVRVIEGDGVAVLDLMIVPGSLAGIRAFFPDPWPKARHNKRRLIRPEIVALMASRIEPGGFIHTATDHSEYAEQMLAVLSAEPMLSNEFEGFAPRPTTRPQTHYERQGLAKGHPIQDLVFIRI